MTSAPGQPSRLNGSAWIGALLIAATVLVYWPVRNHEFVNFDDPDYITGNPRTQAGLTTESVRWAFTQSHSSNWHPLTWMSHMLDCQFFGLKPAGHHLMNLGFHAANAFLLFLLLRRLTATLWRSALVAALFALHPLHVESVAWVSERKDVLSAFFGLLALIAYVQSVQKSEARGQRPEINKPTSGLRLLTSGHYWLALLWFTLGLLSKPMLVTWPFVLLLLDFWPLRRITWPLRVTSAGVWRAVLLEKIPFLLLTLAACAITVMVQRGGGATVSFDALTVGARLAQVPVAYVRYLGKTFWPDDLAAFYPYVMLSWDSPLVLGAMLLLLALTVGVIAQLRSRPFLATGWFWFLGTLVPVIGLVQVGRQAIADRYTYLPHLGLFIAVVWLAAEAAERIKVPRNVRALAGAIVLLVCGVLTSRQIAHWQNTGTLARQSIRATKDNYIAHAQLAGVLVEERKYNEALAECRTALQLRPDFAEAHNTFAIIHARQGRPDDAIRSYLEAARCDPAFPDPHHGLAELYLKRGQFADAERESRAVLQIAPLHLGALFTLAQALHSQNRFDEAIAGYQKLDALKPGLFSVHRGLGSIYALKGDADSAFREFQTAISLHPTNADAHNSLGVLRLGRGQVMEASNHFSLAAKFEPTNALANYQLGNLLAADSQDVKAVEFYRRALQAQPDEPELLNNFAWLLATSPDDHARNGPEAVRLAERGCELTKQQAPLFIGTLAAAYAEAGRFEDAIAAAAKARDLAREQKLDAIAARNEELLQFYRAHKPHREAKP